MSNATKIALAVVAGIIVIVMFFVSMYNGLVSGNESINAGWAQVETQLQRRFDLIPNLSESVKSVLKQEQKVFGDIAEARTRYSGAKSTEEKVSAANNMEGALARLLVIVENYPQLKSNETVQQFMAQLEGTENRISVERSRYNESVRGFNVQVKTFPTNIFASMFGFSARTMFEAAAGAKEVPTVNLEVK